MKGLSKMELLYKNNKEFPPLAWCAICNEGIVSVEHGNNVEVNREFFVEGAWDRDFENGDFAEADWFCGTGGKIEKKRIIFSTPTHVTNGLFAANLCGGDSTL